MIIPNSTNYSLDVCHYIYTEKEASKYSMYKGETYKNSLGILYHVIEDSPSGNPYVRVFCNYTYGSAFREIPKIILIS